MPGVKRDLVQVLNPRSRRYTLIDRTAGTLRPKRSAGPWKGVPIATPRIAFSDGAPTLPARRPRQELGHPIGSALNLLGLTFEDYVRAIEARMPPEVYTSCTASRPV